MIFKNGDTNTHDNYRPISLLNMFYTILATIIHRRIEVSMEPILQITQFGFRKKCSTTDAVQCVRRIIDKGEQTDTDTILALLGWEQAFDKISHKGLRRALERMGMEPKIIRLIEAMYNGATFMVEEAGGQSEWKKQGSGIRQGCPLSPYLFIALMTVLFFDVHRKLQGQEEEQRV